MQPPTVYLIKRGLTEEKIERLRSLLSLTPCAAIVCPTVYDEGYARQLDLFGEITGLNRPIAIIGDFPDDCTAIGESTCRVL